jgi:hypothetical protein
MLFRTLLCNTFILLALLLINTDATDLLPSELKWIQDQEFAERVEKSLAEVRRLLDEQKSPRLATEQKPDGHDSVDGHTYEDKFSLVQMLTNTALAVTMASFDRMGMNEEILNKMKEWRVEKKSVTLRFDGRLSCANIDTFKKQVEGPVSEEVKEISTANGNSSKTTQSKVINIVDEYIHGCNLNYIFEVYSGSLQSSSEEEPRFPILERTVTFNVTTEMPTIPKQLHPNNSFSNEIDLSWFLDQMSIIDDKVEWTFFIDRTEKTCRTPTRNPEVFKALTLFQAVHKWSKTLGFFSNLRSLDAFWRRSMNVSHPRLFEQVVKVFDPVLPIFVNNSNTSSPILQSHDFSLLLNEHIQSLNMVLDQITKSDPDGKSLGQPFSVVDARMSFLHKQLGHVVKSYTHQMEAVENMIWGQMRQSIGKHLQPSHFDEFFRSYVKKLFDTKFVPESFTYAVRRSDHYPDGYVSLETESLTSESPNIPITTITRKLEETQRMSIPLNAAVNIKFCGSRFLHGWVIHSFDGEEQSNTNLVARARQFSSFVLIVGTIAGKNEFDPKHALILQNKDEVVIPLLLEAMPTPKAFADAIESLSPEQQQFAKSFRAMQLESSVLGICVIQLKPQLEAVLALPADSLTKEIRLTQDILSLFIDYQIPPDIISSDLEENATVKQKVDRVRMNVDVIHSLIDDAKKKELEEAKRKAEFENPHMFKDEAVFSTESMMMDTMVDASVEFGSRSGSRRLRRSTALYSQNDDMQEAEVKHEQDIMPLFDLANVSDNSDIDFLSIPRILDSKIELLDSDSFLHSTRVSVGPMWSLTTQANLLSDKTVQRLSKKEQPEARNKAFDLLDAITKSGSLTISEAELHVLVAVTHKFDRSVMETVIEENINPIEKLERSLLIVQSAIHGLPVQKLLKKDMESKISKHSPMLFNDERAQLQ